jgi:hypothetical protein
VNFVKTVAGAVLAQLLELAAPANLPLGMQTGGAAMQEQGGKLPSFAQ